MPPVKHDLPRYERPMETATSSVSGDASSALGPIIPIAELEQALASSDLSEGGKALARGLLAVGGPANFAGGGIGLDYARLLKTAVRPEYLGAHVREVAAHLWQEGIDLLMVPGMSGYPVGAMYATVAEIPAVLLKKEHSRNDDPAHGYPMGSFIIPSYTGDADVVMSADLAAMQDIVDAVVAGQVAMQVDTERLTMTLRIAGADDIIDKATMSRAVSDSALVLGKAAIQSALDRYREATGDRRPTDSSVTVAAWVTPLIKGYNRPDVFLRQWFGLTPMAGLTITGLRLDPPAIGIKGLGVVVLA